MQRFQSSVVGVTFDQRQYAIRRCLEGQYVTLEHQPDNQYDNNAIAVLAQDGSPLGFLASALARRVVGEYGPGVRMRGVITAVLRNHETWGLRIEVHPPVPVDVAAGEWAVD